MATTPAARPSRPSRSTTGLERLGVPPERGDIYDLALTHRSFAYELDGPTEHNERLEFLGDAILGAIVTDLIFTSYPELAEGEMARLRASAVNTQALAQIAETVGLGEHIRLGKGEEGSGGRGKPSLLADTFEAVVGALYIDKGIEATTAVLVPLFEERMRATLAAGDRYDAKTALQETVVRERGGFPEYRVTSTGPDHDKSFGAEVYVDGELYGSGEGKSKKEAEHHAARAALARFGTDDDHANRGNASAPANRGNASDPLEDREKERGSDARAS
ncbi:MAG: ribonuclease III [Actinomycetota bacterium]